MSLNYKHVAQENAPNSAASPESSVTEVLTFLRADVWKIESLRNLEECIDPPLIGANIKSLIEVIILEKNLRVSSREMFQFSLVRRYL